MKKLELWLTEWKFARINYLQEVRHFMREVESKTYQKTFPYYLYSQQTQYSKFLGDKAIIDEKASEIKNWKPFDTQNVAKQYEIDIENNDIISYVEFRGQLFKHSHIYQPIKGKKYDWVLEASKFYGYNPSDLELFQIERTDQWIFEKADKEMKIRKKQIEEKVRKICGDELTEADGNPFNEFIVKGSNGRIAHVFRILAGGYNIQCLHARILVKEVK